jgi:Zn-dependent alcohol dehydrogenase
MGYRSNMLTSPFANQIKVGRYLIDVLRGKDADWRKTFGLNRMDLLQRMGQYPLPPQASKTIMGVEFAGTVTKLGEGAERFKEGDEVFGLAFGVSIKPPSCPSSPAALRISEPMDGGNGADQRRGHMPSTSRRLKRCCCISRRSYLGSRRRRCPRTG